MSSKTYSTETSDVSSGERPSRAALYARTMKPSDAIGQLVAEGFEVAEAEAEIDAVLAAKAATRTAGKFVGRKAATVKPRRQRWLWDQWVPLGAMTLLYGEEGLGKGVTAADIAARATLGFLPGDLEGHPVGVEWVTFEDDPEAVLMPRLIAAEANLDLIHFHDESDAYESPLVLPNDVEELAAVMASRGSRLLIIDPLPDALREGLKDNNNGDVRTGIRPLQQMAKQLDVAVIGVAHPNKGATTAANKVMGSKAWRSVPRSVILLGPDPDDPQGDTRILCVSKTNAARSKPSKRLRIESAMVDGLGVAPRVVIVGDSTYTDADLITFAAVGKAVGGRKPETQDERARYLIEQLLEDGGGEIDAAPAYAAGATVGLSPATMRRARQALKVDSEGGKWSVPADWNPPLAVTA